MASLTGAVVLVFRIVFDRLGLVVDRSRLALAVDGFARGVGLWRRLHGERLRRLCRSRKSKPHLGRLRARGREANTQSRR